MRHDIRTPLTGIVGFADIIKSEAQNPRIKEYSENLIASSHALLSLLDEVLESIRVSSGEIPLLKKKFNFSKTLNQIIALTRSKASQKNIDLSLEIDSNIPNYIIGDKIRLHRVILELIANALNFTDAGFVKLKVEVAKRENREIILKIIVEDSGMGIHADKQQEIYLQFKRLTPSYEGIYKGAGLGLAVVKQFIDELKGEIYVKSQPKKGTIFTCIVPFQEPLIDDDLGIDEEDDKTHDALHETTYIEQMELSTSVIQNTGNHRVLVVEDKVIAQRVAESFLKQFNCAVDIAANGVDALHLWKQNNYELIFMDIGLPDMDGYEVTHHMRVQEIALNKHIPIIALTAHASEENKQRCIEAGMNAVLTKPLSQEKCSDILDSFIVSRRKDRKINTTPDFAADLPETEDGLFMLEEFDLLDVDSAMEITGGDEDIIRESLSMLAEGALLQDVDAMKKAYEDNDWEKVESLAHKIKGGAVYVGTQRMKMACQYLERYYKCGKRDLLEKLYTQALKIIDETTLAINTWLKEV